nr:hypothetical protein [Hyphomonas sp. Mor2]
MSAYDPSSRREHSYEPPIPVPIRAHTLVHTLQRMTDHAEICLQKTKPIIVRLMASLNALILTIEILPGPVHTLY